MGTRSRISAPTGQVLVTTPGWEAALAMPSAELLRLLAGDGHQSSVWQTAMGTGSPTVRSSETRSAHGLWEPRPRARLTSRIRAMPLTLAPTEKSLQVALGMSSKLAALS